MNSGDHNNITEEEAELYDRQIRLWGANVQRSLRNTRVLAIGLKGVVAEACKNLILSGVKSVTMMDYEKVSKIDLNSSYLLYPESIGENRAKASLKAAQVLNPNVKVTMDISSPLDKPASYYSNFDVVVATNQPPTVTAWLNHTCNLYNIKFFYGDSFGMFGFMFEDFSDVKHTKSTVPFQDALNYNWTPASSAKKRKQQDPSYLVFKILMDFQTQYGRNPSVEFNEDATNLENIRGLVLQKFNVDDDTLPKEYLNNVCGEYGPTCSIIGGMIAQEIVKSLSKEDGSTSFIYLFNHLRCQLTGISLVAENKEVKSENTMSNDDNVVEL